jgi:Zn-dependent protease with chaperone function
MGEGILLLLLAALALPHALPLARVNPAAAAAVWLAALALRAVLVTGLALAALLLLPSTPVFQHVANGSLSGEPLAHGAALAPPALLIASLLAFLGGVVRGTLVLRGELLRRALGRGPGGALVIADRAPLVAVPGLGRARIVLSDRALAELDPEELEACLAHEAGHLRRRHRALGLLGNCLAALARPTPGTGAARRGLRLSLERDADEYAVARTGDPLALASAICKIAGGPAWTLRSAGAMLGLDGAGATRARLDALLAGGRRRGSGSLETLVAGSALLMSALAVAAAIAVAVWLADTAPPAALASAVACESG